MLVPVADGGDGTVAAALSAGWAEVVVDAVGPTGEPVRATYARQDHRAVVELAEVVGLDRLPGGRLDPLGASTFGLGLVIKDAVEAGATEVVLGLGGSASTDGGAGMMQASGAAARRRRAAGRSRGLRPAASTRAADGLTVVTWPPMSTHRCSGRTGRRRCSGRRRGRRRREVEILERRPDRLGAAGRPPRSAGTGRRRPAPARRAAQALPPSLCWARPYARASRWCSTWSGSSIGWPERTW